jgi:uracil-DNA glycosylase family 4
VLGIGEGPGKNEDQMGIQFVGEAGQLLMGYLAPYGVELHRDFWLINAVNCRPPKNRTPKAAEIAACRGRVFDVIERMAPAHIWLMGESAIKTFYGGRFSETGIGRWRGLHIPDRLTGAWVHPMYHPSFALRSGKDQNKLSLYQRDLAGAVEALSWEAPQFVDPEQYINLLMDYDSIVRFLNELLQNAELEPITITIDWETTHIKPWYPGPQRIWTAAIAANNQYAAAFPVSYPGALTEEQEAHVKELLRQILRHPQIYKAAHNLQFEHIWAQAILGVTTKGWQWCTMNGAHILDVRKYYAGLKFQAYLHWGLEGYEEEAKKYMKTTEAGINRLCDMPLDRLLMYNGMDALLCWWLYEQQYKQITADPGLYYGHLFFNDGLQALADATVHGIPMDELYYLEQRHSLTERMDGLMDTLTKGEVAAEYHGRTGEALSIVNKDFSAKALRIVLFDILGLPKIKTTATGLASVDKEVLAKAEHPWVATLLEWRKLHKIVGTYIAQFVREIHVGMMHPWYPLHTTRSTRGSSMSPNFQNVPKRDKEAKKITRRGIVASSGHRLCAVDYGAQEVRTAAILSGDPVLMEYCHQPDSDMHADVAHRIWAIHPDWISGGLRFHSKGGFVFSQFYGSYYVSCGIDMWEKCIIEPLMLDEYQGRELAPEHQVLLKDHLVSTGIITNDEGKLSKLKIRGKLETVSQQLADFVNHVKTVEQWFWERFAGLRDWQNRMTYEYQRTGYVSMPFGFRRGGLLNNNKIYNTAIQGTAFHFLLWSYIQLHQWSLTRWQSRLMGQIHDEMLYDMAAGEEQEVLDTTVAVMEDRIREAFEWISVPLVAEPEWSPIDGNWTEMADVVKGANGWALKEAA